MRMTPVSAKTPSHPPRQALVGRDSILIAASGSSRHAGLAGEILFEDLAGIAVDVEYASEYIYRSTQTLHNPCFVVISQSGETADTSEALREAIARGSSTIADYQQARVPDGEACRLLAPHPRGHRARCARHQELYHPAGGGLSARTLYGAGSAAV